MATAYDTFKLLSSNPKFIDELKNLMSNTDKKKINKSLTEGVGGDEVVWEVEIWEIDDELKPVKKVDTVTVRFSELPKFYRDRATTKELIDATDGDRLSFLGGKVDSIANEKFHNSSLFDGNKFYHTENRKVVKNELPSRTNELGKAIGKRLGMSKYPIKENKNEIEAYDGVYDPQQDSYYFVLPYKENTFKLKNQVTGHITFIDKGSPRWKRLRLQNKKAIRGITNESLTEGVEVGDRYIDTAKGRRCKVVNIKDVNREKHNSLGSFKDTDVVIEYDNDKSRTYTFEKGEFIARFRKESLTEDLSPELQEMKNRWEEIIADGRLNVLEFPADYKYIDIDWNNGTIFAGGATNTGIMREFEMPLDTRENLDENIAELYDLIITQRPELLDPNFIDEEEAECEWCGDSFPISELHETDKGHLCDYCIQAIKSHGEPITLYETIDKKSGNESLTEDYKTIKIEKSVSSLVDYVAQFLSGTELDEIIRTVDGDDDVETENVLRYLASEYADQYNEGLGVEITNFSYDKPTNTVYFEVKLGSETTTNESLNEEYGRHIKLYDYDIDQVNHKITDLETMEVYDYEYDGDYVYVTSVDNPDNYGILSLANSDDMSVLIDESLTEDYLEDNEIDDFQLLDKLQTLIAQAPGKYPEAEAFMNEFEAKVSELGTAQAALEDLDISGYDLLHFFDEFLNEAIDKKSVEITGDEDFTVKDVDVEHTGGGIWVAYGVYDNGIGFALGSDLLFLYDEDGRKEWDAEDEYEWENAHILWDDYGNGLNSTTRLFKSTLKQVFDKECERINKTAEEAVAVLDYYDLFRDNEDILVSNLNESADELNIDTFIKLDNKDIRDKANKLFNAGVITKNQLLWGSLGEDDINKLYKQWFKDNGKLRYKPKKLKESVEEFDDATDEEIIVGKLNNGNEIVVRYETTGYKVIVREPDGFENAWREFINSRNETRDILFNTSEEAVEFAKEKYGNRLKTESINEATNIKYPKLNSSTRDMVEIGDALTDSPNGEPKWVVSERWDAEPPIKSTTITCVSVGDWRTVYGLPISKWYGTYIIKGPFIRDRENNKLIKEN